MFLLEIDTLFLLLLALEKDMRSISSRIINKFYFSLKKINFYYAREVFLFMLEVEIFLFLLEEKNIWVLNIKRTCNNFK